MTGEGVAAVDARSVTLSSGEVIPAATLVWCAGMRANPLTAQFGLPLDRLGRLAVDDYLRVEGAEVSSRQGMSQRRGWTTNTYR